jgi:uncharacterized protein (DUF305 family)
MAELAPGRAKSQDVKNLAAKIGKGQAPQIATMSGWLKSWHPPTGDMPSMKGMGGSGSDMSGMMSRATWPSSRNFPAPRSTPRS